MLYACRSIFMWEKNLKVFCKCKEQPEIPWNTCITSNYTDPSLYYVVVLYCLFVNSFTAHRHTIKTISINT